MLPYRRTLHLRVELFKVPRAHRIQQRILFREMQIDRWRRHPDTLRYRPDGHRLGLTRLQQQFDGGVKDFFAQLIA